MKKVYKYAFALSDTVFLTMPNGARILSIQNQFGTACAWAMVDPALPLVTYRINVVGTGHPVPHGVGEYISTAQFDRGGLVFHFFLADRPTYTSVA